MSNEIKKQAEQRMQKSLDKYKLDLAKIRTGRAHSGILDHVLVDYYGAMLPLNQVASVSVSDAKTLTVQPWEAKTAGIVEKAIRESGLGLNPATQGSTIRVPMPFLTEERRRDLIKIVKGEGEDSKVAIRNVRRDMNNELKVKLKDKLISEDEEKRSGDEIQKLTDKYITEVDKLTIEKEKELLTV